MKHSFNLVATAAAACALSSMAQPSNAAEVGQSWYVMPQVTVMMPDHDIDTKNQVGAGLKFGRTIAPAWDLQLGASETRARSQYHQATAGADLLYMPLREQSLRPFALLGAGVEYDRSAVTARRSLPYASLGAGLQYAITKRLGLQADLRRNFGVLRQDGPDSIRSLNTTYATVGLTYAFGDDPAPVRKPAYVPPPVSEPVVRAPIVESRPEPAPAPPPPAPKIERVTLSASELFAFDSATLRPPQPKLDEIAAQLTAPGARSGGVAVHGYTDPLGKASYNQRLSQQRADAVKQYLVGKGVSSDRVSATGHGSSKLVAECKGRMAQAARVKCLEPNRRVEIDPVVIERTVR